NDAGYVFAEIGDIFVVAWRQVTSVAAAMRMARTFRQFAAHHDRGVTILVVIEDSSGLPDAATRDLLARDLKKHEPFTRQLALVYEGEGFRAAAVRSIMVGLQMLSKQTVPTKTFANLPAAVKWLADLRPELDRKEVLAGVASIRHSRPSKDAPPD